MRPSKPIFGYVIAVAVVGGLTLLLTPFRENTNPTTTALIFLLGVLFVASIFGSRSALLVSFLSALSFNVFFLPPFYKITITSPQNWVALFVFLIVATTVGQLSAKVKQRAEIAEDLYTKLDAAFEKASQAEAIKRSEKLKSSLLDAVTHDLRTPLTSIKAAATMLIDEHKKSSIHQSLSPERQSDLLEVINEETDRLNIFVESMVELARIEAGDIEWQLSPISVEEIIANSMRRASTIIKSHSVKTTISPNLSPLHVDPKAIAEAIYNLIENAVKYSASGSLIKVASYREESFVYFVVEDEGIGISIADRVNIFQKFYRTDKGSKGFGMGLAIVKGIVEAHEGIIWVEDGEKGSRFIFKIPIK